MVTLQCLIALGEDEPSDQVPIKIIYGFLVTK